MFRTSFPATRQLDQMDCGPTCLKIISEFYGGNFDIQYLREISGVGQNGVYFGGLLEALEKMKMDGMAISVGFEDFLKKVPLPCIVHWKHNHYMVVYKVSKRKIFVSNPELGRMSYTHADFIKGWLFRSTNKKGAAIIVRPRSDFESVANKYAEVNHGGLSYLAQYFRPYRKLIIQLLGGLILGVFIQIALPFLTQSIVDYGIEYNNTSFITIILIAQLLIYLVQASIEIIRGWILLHMTTRVNIEVISDVILRFMGLPIAFFDTKAPGDFMQRMFDHERITKFLSVSSLFALGGVLKIVVLGLVMLYFSWKIFLIYLLGTTLFFLWHRSFLKKRAVLDYEKFNQESIYKSKVIQFIQGVAEIKFNGSQARRRAEWYSTQIELFYISIKSLKLKQLQIDGGRIINEIKNILIVFVSANIVVSGEITLGTMLAIMFIIGSLNTPLMEIVNFTLDFQDAKLSFKRLGEISSKKKGAIKPAPGPLPNFSKIIFNNVNFKYPGTGPRMILKDVNCSLNIRETTAIVGTSGSGKSTILKLLLKVYEPTEGNILFDDTSLTNFNTDSWRKSCGIVLQDGFLFNDTLRRNITEGGSLEPFNVKRYESALEVSNLKVVINGLPKGDYTVVQPHGANFSGGEQQRILIARAIYKNPDFLLFDEATSSLDSNNESDIMEKIMSFCHNKTLIIVAHRLSTIRNSDKILVVDNGTIVESGNHSELLAMNGVYANLINKQL